MELINPDGRERPSTSEFGVVIRLTKEDLDAIQKVVEYSASDEIAHFSSLLRDSASEEQIKDHMAHRLVRLNGILLRVGMALRVPYCPTTSEDLVAECLPDEEDIPF